jgi:nucleoside-diphosphate-sugar epimerase
VKILLIGGTRNLGHEIGIELLAQGHGITLLNRGVTPDEYPRFVERLRADRRDAAALTAAVGKREFDAVIDTSLYTGPEAAAAVELFAGRTGHYVFISSGQVYLVAPGSRRPYREDEYDFPVMPEPTAGTFDHEEWLYGVHKRAAEAEFFAGARSYGFPFTILRLPMVHGERDHYQRIENYVARLMDGGPIVCPDDRPLDIRHIDVRDAVRAVVKIVTTGIGKGAAYNLGEDASTSFDDALALIAKETRKPVRLAQVPRRILEEKGLLPAASPLSLRWMSALDNTRARRELGLVFSSFSDFALRVVRAYMFKGMPKPAGYTQRAAELALV